METLRQGILENLHALKESGNFASIGQRPFIFPGLGVKNLGEISFPIRCN